MVRSLTESKGWAAVTSSFGSVAWEEIVGWQTPLSTTPIIKRSSEAKLALDMITSGPKQGNRLCQKSIWRQRVFYGNFTPSCIRRTGGNKRKHSNCRGDTT